MKAHILLSILIAMPALAIEHSGDNNQPPGMANNRLYDVDVQELRKVYANQHGQSCIRYSQAMIAMEVPNPADKMACQNLQRATPYSMPEILDPEAIARFKNESLKATCEEQERRVDTRYVRRAPACEQWFSSTN